MKTFIVTIFTLAALMLNGEAVGRYQSPGMVSLTPEQGSGSTALRKTENGWTWLLPADKNSDTISFDLDKFGINPEFYDEIQIRFRNRDSLINLSVELQDYPVTDLRRSWYSKIAIRPGVWNDWRMDMNLDDDSDQELHRQYSGRKLNISLGKRYLRIPGEPPTREVEIAEIKLLRRPVDIGFDEMKAAYRQDRENLCWDYQLELFNKELTPQEVELKLDCSKLDKFQPSWQSKKLTLKPRERMTVPLALSIPAAVAATLPVLYSESVLPELKAGDMPVFFPVMGYRQRRVWAVVPPTEKVDIYQKPAEKVRKTLIADADAALKASWGVPEFGRSKHPSNYLDKESNSKLKQLSWFRHKSIKTGKEITDNTKVNEGNILNIHHDNFRRALLLGQAWRASGNPAYAEAARDVFLEYVRVYPTLPMTSFHATAFRSRLGHSTLMTSFWFVTAIDAYAAIRDSAALGDADRRAIEEQFLAPELAALYGHNIEFTNMQVHHFQVYGRGVAAVGRYWNLLGDALYGDHGFYAMVENSFSEDGMSQEGNVYHIFALKPLLDFAAQMRMFGIEVMNQRFKRVFDGGVENTPDGIIRARGLAGCLRDAWQVYRDPRYLPTLRYHKWLDTPGGELLNKSSVMKNNGYVWLREQSEYGFRALSLNYIMTLDRMEFDRLHFSMFDPGLLCTEVWRISYGAKQAGVMYRTVSHNTVTVDRKDQADVPAKMAAFIGRDRMPGALFTEEEGAPLYSGVRFSRAAAIFDGIMFIGDLQDSDSEHIYDWPLYSVWEPWAHKDTGRFEFPFAMKKAETGYPFMSNASAASAGQGFSTAYGVAGLDASGQRVNNAAPNRKLRITVGGIPGAEVFSAETPRGHMPEPGPVMILRQTGKSATFGAAFEVVPVKGGEARVKSVETVWRDGVSGAWTITADSGRYLVVVNRTGAEIEVEKVKINQIMEIVKL